MLSIKQSLKPFPSRPGDMTNFLEKVDIMIGVLKILMEAGYKIVTKFGKQHGDEMLEAKERIANLTSHNTMLTITSNILIFKTTNRFPNPYMKMDILDAIITRLVKEHTQVMYTDKLSKQLSLNSTIIYKVV